MIVNYLQKLPEVLIKKGFSIHNIVTQPLGCGRHSLKAGLYAYLPKVKDYQYLISKRRGAFFSIARVLQTSCCGNTQAGYRLSGAQTISHNSYNLFIISTLTHLFMNLKSPIQTSNSYQKIILLFFFALILGLALLLDLAWGAISIPLLDIGYILIGGKSPDSAWEYIIWQSRLPRAITAVLAGSALAISGLQMQTLFRNPLAGPSILGITSGASMGVAIVVLTSGASIGGTYGDWGFWGSWYLVLAAILGAALVMSLVLLIALRVRDNVVLLIVGMMLGNLTLALVGLWQYFSSPEQIRDYLIWTFGSLGGVFGEQLGVLAIVVGLGLLGSGLVIKPLNVLLLGENYAQSLGLSVQNIRIILIILSSMLAGSVTAFCGPIGFVGIAIPHLARVWLNTTDHRWLIPAVALLGAVMLLLCDLITKVAGNQASLPINSVTTLLGAPIVIWVIIRAKNLRRGF